MRSLCALCGLVSSQPGKTRNCKVRKEWAAKGAKRTCAREDIYLSAASAWEIAIKAALGNLRLPTAPTRYVPDRLARQGIHPLPVSLTHGLKVYDLPLHHADPFDRLIIAQASVEQMTILTSDRIFEKYPVEIVWCGR